MFSAVKCFFVARIGLHINKKRFSFGNKCRKNATTNGVVEKEDAVFY
jgi:hypothetical protein